MSFNVVYMYFDFKLVLNSSELLQLPFLIQILRRSDESFCFSNGRCEVFSIAMTWRISVLLLSGA